MAAHSEGNALCTLQILGQQSIQLNTRVGEIGTEAIHSPFTAPATPCPDLRGRLTRIDEQNKAFALGPMGQKQRDSVGLIQSCEIPEITVLPEWPLRVCMVGD